MKTRYEPSQLMEKERIRLQISAQVEEFLRRGGAIDVVTDNSKKAAAAVGSAWSDHDDLAPLFD